MATSTTSAPSANEAGPSPSTLANVPNSSSTQSVEKPDGAAPSPTSHNGSNSRIKSKSIPVRDKDSFDKMRMEMVITKDKLATSALYEHQKKTQRDINHLHTGIGEYKLVHTQYRPWFPPSKLYGDGYRGFGNGVTDTDGRGTQLIYPRDRPRPGKRMTQAMPKPRRKDAKEQAEQHEELVPIRVDVDWDKVKLRDTFTWNLHERLVPVDVFAANLIEDLGLKPPLAQPVFEQARDQIREQLVEFYPLVFTDDEALDPELPYAAYKNDEMRVLIKLNITIGLLTLVDQFEWEINNRMNSPEEFAQGMARDLHLSGEFTTAIAHCIREQTQLFSKSLYTVGYAFDGRPVDDPDLTSAFLPSPLPSVFRPFQQAKEYSPYMYEMGEADLERNEVIFSREQRRQKRSVNRRGGPQLPDLKERQRTVRTLIVSSTLPGAAPNLEQSRLFKRPAGVGTGRGRRAANDGISDSEDSEDSAPESPAMSNMAIGTARTRGLRGAASAAQLKMANLNRSETPEAMLAHHEPTRSSRRNAREEEEQQQSQRYWVTLRVSRDKLKALQRNLKNRRQGVAQTPQRGGYAPAPPGSMGPPATPSSAMANLPPNPLSQNTSTPAKPPSGKVVGAVDAPAPVPGQPTPPSPPAPGWLQQALSQLHARHPTHSFAATMRYCAVNRETENVMTGFTAVPGQPLPDNVKYMFVPRIRCHDCTAKLYVPGPEMTVDNFEVHLRNRIHLQTVEARVAAGRGSPSSSSAGVSAA